MKHLFLILIAITICAPGWGQVSKISVKDSLAKLRAAYEEQRRIEALRPPISKDSIDKINREWERTEAIKNSHLSDSVIENMQIILEGTPIGMKKEVAINGNNYVHLIFVISKVLRGKEYLNSDTIEIVYGWYGHGWGLAPGVKSIILCSSINKNIHKKVFGKKTLNKPFLIANNGVGVDDRYYSGHINGLFGLKYKNPDEFIAYVRSHKNISYEPYKKTGLDNKMRKAEADPQHTYEDWLRLMEKKMGKNVFEDEKKKTPSGVNKGFSAQATLSISPLAIDTNLNLSIQNRTLTTSGQDRFLEFDVYASSNVTGTWFNTCVFHLQYDTNTFGANVYQKGRITVMKGTNFNKATYSLYVQSDFTSSVVRIPFSDDILQSTWNRTLITTSPQQIVHIKLKAKRCAPTVQVLFTDEIVTSDFSFFSQTATANTVPAYPYKFTTYNNPPNSISFLPAPVISNFSPTVAHAGNYETLTINGSNFGNSRGTGQVLFKNADVGGIGAFSYLSGLNQDDYVSWSDNQIKLKISSYNPNKGPGNSNPIGTGPFRIRNNSGCLTTSTSALDVQYSLKATSDSVNERKIYDANLSCKNGIAFRLQDVLQYNILYTDAIEKAFATWNAATGIDLRFERNAAGDIITVSSPTATDDGINVIFFDPAITLPDLMITSPYASSSSSTTTAIPSSRTRIYYKGADIGIINSASPFHFGLDGDKPGGKFDFYSAFLHELGHVLGLAHIIDTINTYKELMYYSSPNSYMAAADRANLTTGRAKSKEGAINLRDTSQTITWSGTGVSTIRQFYNPSSATTCYGGSNSSFTTLVDGPTVSYQWQKWNGTTYADLSSNYPSYPNGVTSSTLSVTNPTGTVNGALYRTKVTNVGGTGGCTIYSIPALLTVKGANITVQPISKTVCAGSSTTFSVTATGSNIQYQWQYSTNGVNFSNLSNGGVYSNVTTNTLSVTGVTTNMNNYQYRCLLSEVPSCSVFSNTVTLSIPTITYSPTNSTVCPGEASSFSVYASGTGLTYQWQVNMNGLGSFTNISNGGNYAGATTNSLELNNVASGMNFNQYRCIVTSSTCATPLTSNYATLSVRSSVFPAISATTTGCNMKTLRVSSPESGATYAWFKDSYTTGYLDVIPFEDVTLNATGAFTNAHAGDFIAISGGSPKVKFIIGSVNSNDQASLFWDGATPLSGNIQFSVSKAIGTTFTTNVSGDYYVYKDNNYGINPCDGYSANYNVSFSQINFSNPIDLGTFSGNITNTQNNANACFGNTYTGVNNQPSNEVFYKLVLTGTTDLKISNCGSGFDTYLHVLNSSGGLIAENDDNFNPGACAAGEESYLNVSLGAGTYYVVSEGYYLNTGNIITNISYVSGRRLADLTDTEDLPTTKEVRLYPNPASDFIKVELPLSQGAVSIELFDVNARLVEKWNVHSGKETLELKIKNAPTGLYQMRIIYDGNVWIGKLNIIK